jgi:hypothetical protein
MADGGKVFGPGNEHLRDLAEQLYACLVEQASPGDEAASVTISAGLVSTAQSALRAAADLIDALEAVWYRESDR